MTDGADSKVAKFPWSIASEKPNLDSSLWHTNYIQMKRRTKTKVQRSKTLDKVTV